MEKKSLFNLLELAYAPITAYEFAVTKNDFLIRRAIEDASLYVIGQRPVITFENFSVNAKEYQLYFEIHQRANLKMLKCKLPLIQSVVGSTDDDTIGVAFNYLDKVVKKDKTPLNNIHGFSLYQVIQNNKKFLIWFSPEKLLQNWWSGDIECEIVGDFRAFLNYKVLYVGKATKQSIFKRLTGHSTFQDILSLETPVTEKQLPANEIVILCFKFQDNLQIQSFNIKSDINNVVAAFQGNNYPKEEKVFLDAEKALIKAMKPSYNKELFNSYPKSKDGLYKDSYDVISYTFIDPIKLIYKHGNISGGLPFLNGDSILILNNNEVKLIKH